ncbi:polyisoprenoid diphosphate/phosphate phosphohydrolase PLPP6-like [Oppia nitens]|uniref:polyisoprenoid diphosphate/phosphate phosphohydrolase PLPP6-like n=1 Tax=Oppia nitens TaxID=1686743 RepID=UPI0023DCA07F|nr:polyisoprenoid diphosphate/phosphate phosphohydrolase PLPP6-like [Oppia nitens]
MMVKLNKNLMENLKAVDQNISLNIYRSATRHIGSRVPSYHRWLRALEYSCHGIFWLVATIISLYLVSNNKAAALLLTGLILDIIAVAVIKAMARRRRPGYARQDDHLTIGPDKHSFPSGHCSRAIYLAMFFGNLSPLLSLAVWLWSLSVCASRVLLGRHHLFDAVFGAFLGYLIYSLQYTIFTPINTLFVWLISALFNVVFSDTNDFD